jgi:acetyltransferase
MPGAAIRIRPIRPSDLELERRFFAGLSTQSRYFRLFSLRPLQPGELEHWTDIDPRREIALIALAGEDGAEQEAGVARCALEDAAEGRWEFAIVIADAWQRRGLGEALLRALVQKSREAGATTMVGVTLSENRGMLALAQKLGFSAHLEVGDATLTRLVLRLRE